MLRQTAILDMFGRSPVHQLQQHMEKVHTCVKLLFPFFDALVLRDWERAIELQGTITELENEADELKRNFQRHLPKSLFLPVPRSDLITLLARQDKIANTAKDIAGITLGRKIEIPASLIDKFKHFLTHSIKASTQARNAINELDALLVSRFRGKEAAYVHKLIQQVNQIEYQADQLQIELRQSLFQIEKTLLTVNAIFSYKIIEQIGYLEPYPTDW
ncbi:TIGR00153 family protein [Coxiella endosymbiont of Ornithodoros maritimus]|uniref:TIGR00153 family protein n=1 Tax=Coxiella endosymbiont of Ornithodoros maritimus TaxID=1656172 RepID=UPI002263C945|nr:TIGR00153 family protein [Coxiella endosymbiont of Ornithodoros maritimus]